MLLRSDSSDSSPRSLAPDQQDSERNLEDIMNTTRDKLQVLEKELNSTPTESIANLFLDLFDSGLGAEEAGHSDWFARSAELLDEFKSLHHKVQEVEERNQDLSHLNIDLLRRNFHLETLLQKLGVDMKIIEGVESFEEQLNPGDDTSISQPADSSSNPTICLQSFHAKSEDAASRQQSAVLQKSSSLPTAVLQKSSSLSTSSLQKSPSKASVLQKSSSLPTDDQDKAFRAVADMLSANNYKNQQSFSQSAAGYKLCNHCHQIIYPLEVYSNLQLENNQLKYQLIHLESNRLSSEFKIMILKQEVAKLKDVCKDKSRMEDQVISLLEETSTKGAKASHEGAKADSMEDGEGVLDDCSRLDSNFDLPDDLTEIGDSCLIQTSSAERNSFGAKTDKKGSDKDTTDDRLIAQVAKLKVKVSKLKNSKSILKIRTRELLSEYRKKRDLLKQRDEQLSHVKLWLTKLHALHVRLQNTHSDILENVKEELKIIATLALQNNPNHHIHSKQSQIQPDTSQIQPDTSQIQPDKSQNQSNKSQIIPDNSQICSEQSKNSDFLRKQNGCQCQSCDDEISADLDDNIQSQNSITIKAKSNQSESKIRSHDQQSDQLQKSITIDAYSNLSESSNRSHDQQSDQSQKSIPIEAHSKQSESSNRSNEISDYKIENLFGLIKTMLVHQSNRSSFDSHNPSTAALTAVAAGDVTDAAIESLSLIYTPKPVSIGRQ